MWERAQPAKAGKAGRQDSRDVFSRRHLAALPHAIHAGVGLLLVTWIPIFSARNWISRLRKLNRPSSAQPAVTAEIQPAIQVTESQYKTSNTITLKAIGP